MIISFVKAGTATSGHRSHSGIPGRRGGSAKSRNPVTKGKLSIKANSKLAKELDYGLRMIKIDPVNYGSVELAEFDGSDILRRTAYNDSHQNSAKVLNLVKEMQGFDGASPYDTDNHKTRELRTRDDQKIVFLDDSKLVNGLQVHKERNARIKELQLNIIKIEQAHLYNNPDLSNLTSKEWKESKIEMALISTGGINAFAVMQGYDGILYNDKVVDMLNNTKVVIKSPKIKSKNDVPVADTSLEALAKEDFPPISQSINRLAQLMIDNEVEISKQLGKPMREYIAETEAEMADTFRDAEYVIRVPKERIKDFEREGLLNTYQLDERGYGSTNKRSEFYKKGRILLEQANGIDVGTKPDDRPLYGGMNLKNGYKSNISPYGEIELVLDDTSADRSAFTVGDSLNDRQYVRASSPKKPSIFSTNLLEYIDNSEDYSPAGIVTSLKGVRENLSSRKLITRKPYIEFQIFGGVNLSHVKKVRVPRRYQTEMEGDEIEEVFGKRGIEIEWTS